MDAKEKVYSLLKNIPKGKVTTYKSLAKQLHLHPRTVALALKCNKDPLKIPCYKVIHADGRIGGYSAPGGVPKKIELLKRDKIPVINSKIPKEYHYLIKECLTN